MDQIIIQTLHGLVNGMVLAMVASGLTLIFGIMRVVNFTHGELYAFGAYLTYLFVALLHLDFFLSIALAALAGFALGALIELLLLRPLRTDDIDTVMLVMIGAWIALQNAEQLAWSGVAKSIDNPFPAAPLVIGALSVAWNRVFVFVVALLLIAATYALINHTRLGKAMRATFQDRDTAALMGIQIGTIHTATFALKPMSSRNLVWCTCTAYQTYRPQK